MALTVHIKGSPEDFDGVLPLVPRATPPLVPAQRPAMDPPPATVQVNGVSPLGRISDPQVQQALVPPHAAAASPLPAAAAPSGMGEQTTQQFSGATSVPHHTGPLGKIWHGVRYGLEAAGSEFAPTATAMIPGTQLHQMMQQRFKTGIQREQAQAQEAAGAGQLSRERAQLAQEEIQAGMPAAEVQAQLGAAAQRFSQAGLTDEEVGLIKQMGSPQDQQELSRFNTMSPDDQANFINHLASTVGATTVGRQLVDTLRQQWYENSVAGHYLFVPDPQAPGGMAAVPMSRTGQPMGNAFPAVGPSGAYSHTTMRPMTMTDAHGNQYVVYMPQTSTPNIPGMGGAPASPAQPHPVGGTVAQPQGGNMPAGAIPFGHKPLGQAEKQQLGYIDTTMGTLGQLAGTLRDIQDKHQQGQLSDVAAKRALWAAYNVGFASDMSQMMAQVSLNSILGSLAYMKGTRAYRWISQIQQHLPKPTDSYDLMQEKIANAEQMLPWVKYGVMVTEGLMPANAQSVVWNKKTGEIGMKYPGGKISPMPSF